MLLAGSGGASKGFMHETFALVSAVAVPPQFRMFPPFLRPRRASKAAVPLRASTLT